VVVISGPKTIRFPSASHLSPEALCVGGSAVKILCLLRLLAAIFPSVASSCDPTLRPVVVTYYADRDSWELVDDYVLECADFRITVPSGYSFDLASVPRFFWRVIAPFELSLVAPLIHDFIYEYKGSLPPGSLRLADHALDESMQFTRKQADALFLELMQREGVKPWRRKLAYWAVRLFGKF
jgi:hypothetical protein